MRYACTVLLVLGLTASVSAQRRQHHQQPAPPQPRPPAEVRPLPPIGTPQNSLGLPAIGLPLTTIGLPLPTIGVPSKTIGVTPPTQPMSNRAYRGGGRRGLYQAPVIYTVPPYGYPAGAYGVVTEPVTQPIVVAPPAAPEPIVGGLRLEVEPQDQLKIFVDGAFVGSPRDIGNEIALETGTRWIELRAEGYKSQAFNVQIIADRTITYRATLERDGAALVAAPPPVVPTGSRTLYVIPGCYLGNVAPQEIKLPPGCDLTKLRTIQ